MAAHIFKYSFTQKSESVLSYILTYSRKTYTISITTENAK